MVFSTKLIIFMIILNISFIKFHVMQDVPKYMIIAEIFYLLVVSAWLYKLNLDFLFRG